MAEEYSVADCVSRLVAYAGSLHIAHWLADTVTNEHKALGDLYDEISEQTDKFAEVYMGKYGEITFPKDAKITDVTGAPAGYGVTLVTKLQKEFTAGKDDELLNILADMSAALNKAKYLLKETGEPEEAEAEITEEPEEAEGEASVTVVKTGKGMNPVAEALRRKLT